MRVCVCVCVSVCVKETVRKTKRDRKTEEGEGERKDKVSLNIHFCTVKRSKVITGVLVAIRNVLDKKKLNQSGKE